MKKFTKVSLILTAILFALAITFCSIAYVMGGGYRAIRQRALDGEFDAAGWHFGPDGVYYDGDYWDWDFCGFSWSGTHAGGNEHQTDTYALSEIDRIEADLDFADIKIVRGTGGDCVVKMEKGFLEFYSCDLQGDILKIDYHKDRKNYRHGAKITVAIPDEAALSGINIYTALGDIELKELNLTCAKTELYTSLGEVSVLKTNLIGDLRADTSMGDVTISGGRYQSADTSTSMGDIDIKGEFSGDVTAVTSMGDVDASLLGREEDYYNYNLRCDMGDLEFNGEDCTKFMGGEKDIRNSGAAATVYLESDMGSVTLHVEN